VAAPGEYTDLDFPCQRNRPEQNVKYLRPVIDDFQVPVVVESVIGAHAKSLKKHGIVTWKQGRADGVDAHAGM
jgi:hypothetical protein